MKKIVVLLAVVWCTWTAQAGDYAYLVFTNTIGSATVLNVTGLTMNVEGTSLQVTNTTEHVSLALADLASMQFSNDPTAIENVLDGDKPLDVFTPLGLKIGRYDNLLQAAGSLPAGAYVISNGRVTQKIVVK